MFAHIEKSPCFLSKNVSLLKFLFKKNDNICWNNLYFSICVSLFLFCVILLKASANYPQPPAKSSKPAIFSPIIKQKRRTLAHLPITLTQNDNIINRNPNQITYSKPICVQKEAPLVKKSIHECLYEYCLESANGNERSHSQSAILDLEYISGQIEPHYDYGHLFCVYEALELIKNVCHVPEEATLNMFDLFDNFEKTYTFYVKLGTKESQEHVDDLKNLVIDFAKRVNHSGINLTLEINKANKAAIEHAQKYWKRISEFAEKTLDSITTKQSISVELVELNYLFFRVAQHFVHIFAVKIFDAKICKNRLGFRDYFNLGDSFFRMLLEKFESLVVNNIKKT